MNNPLLKDTKLPLFAQIKPEHVETALDNILENNRKEIAAILTREDSHSWDSVIHPIENLDDCLSKMWSAVNHMNSVVNSKDLRKVYNACLPKLSDYGTELGQNVKLYEAVKAIKNSDEFKKYDTAQRKVINDQLRDFKLAGVALNEKDKKR